jgi:hypothetical protein
MHYKAFLLTSSGDSQAHNADSGLHSDTDGVDPEINESLMLRRSDELTMRS